MYAKNTRPSAKCEVQKERSAKRDNQIARLRRAQTCERWECAREAGRFFISQNIFLKIWKILKNTIENVC